MMRSPRFTLLATTVAFAALACSSNDSPGGDGDGDGDGDGNDAGQTDSSQADAASTDANEALCAEPGAVGNSEGVGQYCQSDADCSGLAAGLCTVSQQPDAPPFCTKICFDSGTCGEEASCEGDGPIKGCTPACVVNGDDS